MHRTPACPRLNILPHWISAAAATRAFLLAPGENKISAAERECLASLEKSAAQ